MAIATGLAILGAAAIGAGTSAIISSQQRKAQEEAQEQARQTAAAQEVKATEEARVAEEKITAATKLTPEEEAREARMFGLEERRLPILEERAGRPGEELIRGAGPIAGATLDEILAGIQDPGARYEATLEPELELARQWVNQQAVRRGVFEGLPEGGIRFEQLGRAGVELAIKSARERTIARQQDVANAAAVIQTALAEETGARGEMGDYLKNIQILSERGREREAGGVVAGQQLTLPVTERAREVTTGTELELAGYRAGEAAAERGALAEGLGGLTELAYERATREEPSILEEEVTKKYPTERLRRTTGAYQFGGGEYSPREYF